MEQSWVGRPENEVMIYVGMPRPITDDTVSCEASERVSVDEGKGTGEGKEAKGEGQGDEEAGEGEEEERREEEEEDDKEGGEMDVDEVQRQSTAQRIHRTIVRSILPSLQAVLTKKVSMRVSGLECF